ncbi:hypothetical protein CMV30_07960 [Nibricoccus aquaticus]|uniref:Uncharacterized protein n=1 Tax=Nibricoccus aquaticus TaxID=2576891 RepID=A0A290Q6J5_9BACT|nr:hypothetical protein [Nibricoccus aquaticus]ATC63887.1 hypothetical protein CMV30_07960 [Nibricoccus aquaticus]
MNTPACTSRPTCDCDSRFLLPVGLLATDDAPALSACLRCGTLHSPETLTPSASAWLARWPRLLATPDGDFACLPAAVRCTNLRELETIRAAAWNAQRHLPRGRRLNRAGWPATPPPASLPSSLSHYRLLWEAAAFTPATDLDTLLFWALPAHTLVSPLALNALIQRRDLRSLLHGLAYSPVLHRRTVLCALAHEDSSLVPLLRPHLQAWLNNHDRAPDSPQKRALSPEAELCRARLHLWQLTHTFAQPTPPPEAHATHEAPLSAAA